jgi:hypothetical protein
MEGFASFVPVKSTLSDGRSIQWKVVPSGKQLKVKASLDGAPGKLYCVPKATREQSGFSLERWLDEKFVVAAAAEDKGDVDLLPTALSPFRSNVRRRREPELFLFKNRACNSGYNQRRHTGDLVGEQADLSGRCNDLEEELEAEHDGWEDEDKDHDHCKEVITEDAEETSTASERNPAPVRTAGSGNTRNASTSPGSAPRPATSTTTRAGPRPPSS